MTLVMRGTVTLNLSQFCHHSSDNENELDAKNGSFIFIFYTFTV